MSKKDDLIKALYRLNVEYRELIQTADDLIRPLHRTDISTEWTNAKLRTFPYENRAQELVKQYEQHQGIKSILDEGKKEA